MKDWTHIHNEIARKERRAIILADATAEQWQQGKSQKRWPTGALYLWSIGVLDAPGTASTEKDNGNADAV